MEDKAFADSARPGNGWTLDCPTTGREMRFLVCAFQKRKHWRGEDFAAHDCKGAMNGGKCPVMHMMTEEWRTREVKYFDAEVRVHRVPRAIVEAMEKLIIVPGQLAGLDLTTEQRARLLANEVTITQDTGPEAKPKRGARRKPLEIEAGVETGTIADALDNVGDMSALINKAIAA